MLSGEEGRESQSRPEKEDVQRARGAKVGEAVSARAFLEEFVTVAMQMHSRLGKRLQLEKLTDTLWGFSHDLGGANREADYLHVMIRGCGF